MSGSNVHFQKRSITELSYSTPGSYNFVVPAGVTMINILGIGGGAGGGKGSPSYDTAGAGDIENIFAPVTPGETVSITVGNGGAGRASGLAAGNGDEGEDTIVSTAAKDYYFLGGVHDTDTFVPDKRLRYASNGSGTSGGRAGYGDGGDSGGVGTDGGAGGTGAGGGGTTDNGQNGGDGGDGLVKIWYKFNS